MTDNAHADIMMAEASIVQLAPAEARNRLRAARDRVAMIRDRMYSVGAVRYDKDRVQSSGMHDISDSFAALQDAEDDMWAACMAYTAALASLRCCCQAAGFGRRQTDIWMMYYGYGHSMGSIALLTRSTKSQVQYMLTGVRPSRDFCLGVDRVAESGDII